MANAGAKLSSFPEVNDIQTGDMFPLLSGGNTNAKIDYATLANAIIAKLKSETGDSVLSINGKTGAVTINKSDVGLDNVDNTSDADKPISTAVQEALDDKANNAVSEIINDHINNKNNPHVVTKAQVGLGSVVNLDQSKAIKSITRSGTTFTATALDGTATTFTQQDSSTTYGIATSSADGLMSKTDKAKLDGVAAGADVSPIKTVKVNGTALTPDSNKAVNVTVPTLANNATTTAGGMALDARMGKTLADQASQFAKNTAQIETAGTATSAHSVGEYVMISNALYKVTASVAKGDTWTIGTNVTAASVGSEISSLKSDLANKLYPVGSIYMSVNATNPAALFGGTWEQIKGRFLLGVGPNDANTTDWWGSEPEGRVNAPAGELGGESWHTLTVDEMPSHAHIEMANNTFSTPDGRSKLVDSSNNGEYKGFIFDLNNHTLGGWSNTGTVIETMPSGGSSPHNNMPPYLAVYMWKRTA